jgi:predicted O-linked N-acetylglucosamine transferase (SPINDLY family)
MDLPPPDPARSPDHDAAEAALGRAAAHLERGAFETAMAEVSSLLAVDPRDPEANLVKGLAELGLGRLDEAESSLRRSLAADPEHAFAWSSLARVLERRGAWAESADARLAAWRFEPGDAALAAAAAGALFNAGQPEAALEPARAAAALAPEHPAFEVRLAQLLASLDRREKAREVFDRVVSKRPASTAVRFARGVAALPSVPADLDDVERARRVFDTEVDASSREADSSSAIEGLELFGDGGLPWPFLRAAWFEPDPAAARRVGAIHARAARAAIGDRNLVKSSAPSRADGRLRGGVLSGLWFDHVVAHLVLDGWMRHLDRSRFEVVAIDVGRRRDDVGDALLARADRVERGVRPFGAWVETIERLGCEAILLPEVGIESTAARLASLRLAPVQAVSWGHPETTGLDSIDAFLSSELMEPADAASHYAERLVRLPGLGATIDRPAMPNAARRESIGWSRDGAVFWCAQTTHKHHPRFDRLYASIAAAVEGSRFVFAQPHASNVSASRFRARLERAFAEAGADPGSQLEFLPRLDTDAFRSRLAAADLFLDPPGWSGGHTSLEAIAAAVPIVTMPGAFMRRRHAFGILSAIDPNRDFLHEMVVGDEGSYVERAIELARDRDRRGRLSAAIAATSDRAFGDAAPIRALEDWIQQAVRERNA